MVAYTRIHVGPAHVDQWAEKLTRAGYPPALVGTEHLYVWLPMADDGWGIVPAMDALERAVFGASYGVSIFPAVVVKTREAA